MTDNYITTRMDEYRNNLAEWLKEPGMADFARDARIRFLKSSLCELRKKRKSDVELIRKMLPTDSACLVPLVEKIIERTDREIRRYTMEKRILEGKMKEGDITSAMIEQAKEFPVSSLIEVDGRCKAKCINHDDSHPSMDCRNNFVYCYSCGYSDDAIGVYRKLHGVGFVEAVRALSGV